MHPRLQLGGRIYREAGQGGFEFRTFLAAAAARVAKGNIEFAGPSSFGRSSKGDHKPAESPPAFLCLEGDDRMGTIIIEGFPEQEEKKE